MEQNLFAGPPQPGSARERMFKDYSQQLKDTIQKVITKRRNGEETESVPFIDALLQSGVPDEQVSNLTIVVKIRRPESLINSCHDCHHLQNNFMFIIHTEHTISVNYTNIM